jgi:hypothetical protein
MKHDITQFWEQLLAGYILAKYADATGQGFIVVSDTLGSLMWILDEDYKKPWCLLKLALVVLQRWPWGEIFFRSIERDPTGAAQWIWTNPTFLKATATFAELLEKHPRKRLLVCWYEPCLKMTRYETKDLQTCGRCGIARYCSTRCQQDDYLGHKDWCKDKVHQALLVPPRLR